METRQIIQEISDYVKKHGGFPKEWYVGIATDARARLFTDHNVDEQGAWIFMTAESSKEAREIEDYFLNTVGMDGGPGGGEVTSKKVYAYKKTSQTEP